MKIYRCVTKDELKRLVKGLELDLIYKGKDGFNTFNYEDGPKIHFYYFAESAEKCNNFNFKRDYIIQYEIEDSIAMQYTGYGFYKEYARGLLAVVPEPEFAIPAEMYHENNIIAIRKKISPTWKNSEYNKYLKRIPREAVSVTKIPFGGNSEYEEVFSKDRILEESFEELCNIKINPSLNKKTPFKKHFTNLKKSLIK